MDLALVQQFGVRENERCRIVQTTETGQLGGGNRKFFVFDPSERESGDGVWLSLAQDKNAVELPSSRAMTRDL